MAQMTMGESLPDQVYEGYVSSDYFSRPSASANYLAIDYLLKSPTIGQPGQPEYLAYFEVFINESASYFISIYNPDLLSPGQPLVQNPTPDLGIAEYTGWRTAVANLSSLSESDQVNIGVYGHLIRDVPSDTPVPSYLILLDNLRWMETTTELPSGKTDVLSPCN